MDVIIILKHLQFFKQKSICSLRIHKKLRYCNFICESFIQIPNSVFDTHSKYCLL